MTVIVERAGVGSGEIVWVWIDRPQRRNAMDTPTRAAMIAAIDEASGDPAARAVVVAGRGGIFSAGADLREHDSLEPDQLLAQLGGRRVQDAIVECACPVVAMVDGPCLGGGLEVALAAYLRVASMRATFGAPEARVGLIPGGGGTQRLPLLAGPGAAARLMFTGQPVDAVEAHRIGIIDVLAGPDDVEAVTSELCAAIAANSPGAVALAKRALRGGDANLRAGLDRERRLLAEAFAGADFAEGIAAFRERRPPRFPRR